MVTVTIVVIVVGVALALVTRKCAVTKVKWFHLVNSCPIQRCHRELHHRLYLMFHEIRWC